MSWTERVGENDHPPNRSRAQGCLHRMNFNDEECLRWMTMAKHGVIVAETGGGKRTAFCGQTM